MMWKPPPSTAPHPMNMRTCLLCFLLGPLLGACVTTSSLPSEGPADTSSQSPGSQSPGGDSSGQEPIDPFLPPAVQGIEAPLPVPRAVSFEDLPGWDEASLTGAVEAFSRSCQRWRGRQDSDPVSSRIQYAGTIGEWRAVCAAIEVVEDSNSARRVFEALFTPLEVLSGETQPRFTGYFEPEIEARRTPVFPYTQPIPGLPDDLVQVDGARLGGKAGQTVPAQRLAGGRLRPYPPRAEIVDNPANILGYAHPADVFFLQIQGSGRLKFSNGTVIRAAYAAHNGQPFKSTANYLIREGKISQGQASMQGIRAWMDRVSREEAQIAMNANPRFVFFRALQIGDPMLGPEGAASVPLTPLGSMAVDRSIHALGVPFFVQTTAPGLGGDWSGLLIAQDTGGAIKGRVRGDIYYGTGDEAGARAGTQNAPGRMWAFLPRAIAARIIPPPADS